VNTLQRRLERIAEAAGIVQRVAEGRECVAEAFERHYRGGRERRVAEGVQVVQRRRELVQRTVKRVAEKAPKLMQQSTITYLSMWLYFSHAGLILVLFRRAIT
jgi:hypothetical protein